MPDLNDYLPQTAAIPDRPMSELEYMALTLRNHPDESWLTQEWDDYAWEGIEPYMIPVSAADEKGAAWMGERQEPSPIEAIMRLAQHLGVKDINELPGCWEEQVDEQWWIALNGHDEDVVCSRGAKVPPFTAFVQYNGWPAALIHAMGEGDFAAGEAANVWTFDAAVNARIAGQMALA